MFERETASEEEQKDQIINGHLQVDISGKMCFMHNSVQLKMHL